MHILGWNCWWHCLLIRRRSWRPHLSVSVFGKTFQKPQKPRGDDAHQAIMCVRKIKSRPSTANYVHDVNPACGTCCGSVWIFCVRIYVWSISLWTLCNCSFLQELKKEIFAWRKNLLLIFDKISITMFYQDLGII